MGKIYRAESFSAFNIPFKTNVLKWNWFPAWQYNANLVLPLLAGLLCRRWTAGSSGERASSYFTRSEVGIELLFVQACRAHNEQHGVSVRAGQSGHASAEAGG